MNPRLTLFALGLLGLLAAPWSAPTFCQTQKPQLVVQIGHSQFVRSVAFSPDGKTLASGSGDNTIKLWDTATGKLIRTLTGHSDEVMSVAFSPDGKTLASGSQDGTVKIWDIVNGQLRRTLAGDNGTVDSVAFNPNGKTLACGSLDNSIKLWNTQSGQELASLYALGDSDWAIITPGGRFDASPGGMAQMHYVVGLKPIGLAQLKGRHYEPGLLGKLLGF